MLIKELTTVFVSLSNMILDDNLLNCLLTFFFTVSLEIKNADKKIIFCEMMLFPLGRIVTNGPGRIYIVNGTNLRLY